MFKEHGRLLDKVDECSFEIRKFSVYSPHLSFYSLSAAMCKVDSFIKEKCEKKG